MSKKPAVNQNLTKFNLQACKLNKNDNDYLKISKIGCSSVIPYRECQIVIKNKIKNKL
jgi:hypothetical protein